MTDRDRLAATQQFFGSRANNWDERFPDDGPKFARAIQELDLPPGAVVLDAGCGTGRSFASLRSAIGAAGIIIGLDVTPEMLQVARRAAYDARAMLLLGDATQLPLAGACLEAVFAAGLLHHFEEPTLGLKEFARVTRPGGRLAVFHPIGRQALAARHQRVLSDDDLLAPNRLHHICQASGWELEAIDDADDRFLALAVRR